MLAHEYDTLREVEDRHWWHAVLRHLVLRALQDGLPNGGRILDAGCGTGGMMTFLNAQAPNFITHGVDISEIAVRYAQKRGLERVLMASVHDLPFEDESLDAVLSLDVLYHAGVDELRAMGEMTRVLRPGGLLLLNLPAFECLRGSHDKAVCGARRYTPCHVRFLVRDPSLEIVMYHFWNAWLFLPLLVWRHVSRLLSKGKKESAVSDLRLSPVWLENFMTRMGQIDAWLCRVLRLPFGSSLFVEIRKRQPNGGGRP